MGGGARPGATGCAQPLPGACAEQPALSLPGSGHRGCPGAERSLRPPRPWRRTRRVRVAGPGVLSAGQPGPPAPSPTRSAERTAAETSPLHPRPSGPDPEALSAATDGSCDWGGRGIGGWGRGARAPGAVVRAERLPVPPKAGSAGRGGAGRDAFALTGASGASRSRRRLGRGAQCRRLRWGGAAARDFGAGEFRRGDLLQEERARRERAPFRSGGNPSRRVGPAARAAPPLCWGVGIWISRWSWVRRRRAGDPGGPWPAPGSVWHSAPADAAVATPRGRLGLGDSLL